MAVARAPAPRMVLLMRFHHRRGGLSGGLARRAGGLEVRPERRLRRLITASLGDPVDPFASSDYMAPVVVQHGGRRAAAVAGHGATRTPQLRMRILTTGFLTGCDFALLSERRQILPASRSLAPSPGRSRHAWLSRPGC
jgi:hypothetical protein